MLRLWFQLLLITQIITIAFGESQYSIVAPGTIRSNRKFSVAVNLHDAPAPANITVTILSMTRSWNLNQEVTLLQPHTTKLIDFMPSNLIIEPYYIFNVQGVGGVVFEKLYRLTPIKYGGPTVFVESDRAIYKPEDIVQFRVLILDEHLKPINIFEPIRVEILDANKNRVKQFKDIKLRRGVFAAKLPLSRQPILGNWTIGVFISGKYSQHEEYHFHVEEYVLPKFSVYIETDRNFARKERYLKARVYGKYTFGKYVEGTAEVKLSHARYQSPVQTVAIENDTVKAEVVLDTALFEPSKQFIVHATLTEKLTNVKAIGEAVVNAKFNRYNYIVPESDIEFRGKHPYRMKVYVEHWNGTRVTDVSSPVTMSLGQKSYKSYLNDEGTAQFEFEYDPDENFKFIFADDEFYFENLLSNNVAGGGVGTCTVKIKMISDEQLTESLEMEISDTMGIPYFFYTITSHGNIIRNEYVQVADNLKSHTIILNVTAEMIPQSYLYAHYIVNNEMRYCETTIRLPEKFKNEISISAPTSVKPGQEITMNISGQANSHVSIVAVDKSSLLLSSHNLLSMSKIIQDLRYDRAYVPPNEDGYRPGEISGLITLTDAIFFLPPIFTPLPKDETSITYTYQTRSVFPETWFFEDMEIDKAVTPLTVKVPDTITTWIVRAYSVNDYSGFGMMESTVDILAFQPFFISTNLPYSVKRGEVVTIPITIFNYLEQSYPTEVIIDNSKAEFTFVDTVNRPLNGNKDTRYVDVPANNGKSVAFVIIAKKLGDIDIPITAKNSNMTDSILHKLKVVPEGIKQQHSHDATFSLTQGQIRKTTFQAGIPTNIISESEYLTLSVSGDVLVPTLENLDDLVQKPSGCGEQNMINLVPNILILDYLKAIGKYSYENQTEFVNRAKSFIDMGYQQQLTYRHSEGGYSVFGPEPDIKESNGTGQWVIRDKRYVYIEMPTPAPRFKVSRLDKESNWLTAYVTRFFIKSKRYSAVESRIINSDLEFLAKQQTDNGSFPQRGYLFTPSYQNQYGFTAFVLLAFLEDDKYSRKYSKTIEKAMNFLTTNLNSINDTYSLAIMANVFQKTGSSHTNNIIAKLKSKAWQDNDLIWWTNDDTAKHSANSVEITAYTLMALLETPGHYSTVFNWLLQQRNGHGGFGNTQDTVVGLQALIKYAEKSGQSGSEDTHLKVHYMAKDAVGQNVMEQIFGIDDDNKLIFQTHELPRSTRTVEVEIMGSGKVFLQLAYHYYIPTDKCQTLQPRTEEHQSYFIITPIAKFSFQSNSMNLAICYIYQPPRESEDSSSNMVILQIQLPSGFVSNKENIVKLREEDEISRVELQSSSTKLAIYFERLEANNEQCLTIVADRINEVQSLQSSVIEMYDYYNPERRNDILYDVEI